MNEEMEVEELNVGKDGGGMRALRPGCPLVLSLIPLSLVLLIWGTFGRKAHLQGSPHFDSRTPRGFAVDCWSGGAAGDGHGKDMLDTLLTGSKFWSELNIENHDIETILLV